MYTIVLNYGSDRQICPIFSFVCTWSSLHLTPGYSERVAPPMMQSCYTAVLCTPQCGVPPCYITQSVLYTPLFAIPSSYIHHSGLYRCAIYPAVHYSDELNRHVIRPCFTVMLHTPTMCYTAVLYPPTVWYTAWYGTTRIESTNNSYSYREWD